MILGERQTPVPYKRSPKGDTMAGECCRRVSCSRSARGEEWPRMNDPVGQEGCPAPRRVVVAEDETLIRMDLVEMLREEGYDVVGEAEDGQRAVELAEEHKPDLVIMDVKMPR